ncbi:MAG: metallophosphoesterase [Nitrospinaceae bacterium]|nr:metallophosphoesterase [Nitrospinaceae bacterium]
MQKLILFLCVILLFFTKQVAAKPSTKTYTEILRVGIVGDTGVGERAYHQGFIAVAEALKNQNPDLLLHLGDFVYQPKLFPQICPERYVREIRETLVDPFQHRLFVPGDNDLPPQTKKPKGSGCWEKIDRLDNEFDPFPASADGPGPYEGTVVLGNTFFAVLNTYPWQDPTPWLAPRVAKAKGSRLWVIIALHEPAITTAWYLDKRDTVLKQINSLKPDLVFSGNQHSYERFHPIGIPEQDGALPFVVSESGNYSKGDGAIHVISGGGGATFKPFADQQGYKKRTAPKEVFDALATRALMNHFVILDIQPEILQATTYRVCSKENLENPQNPRWKAGKSMWETITLECEGKDAGVTIFDRFQIHRLPRQNQ